ncbi:MAG: AAA family ATPase, partial [Bacteroidales bacterium]|nr:AAA family ATPase [Bacteroidales bacterium]
METGRKKLPLGIQVFEKLINNNLVYVDKTKYLIDLIENGELYFFTRPRRFGKTLTVSTFEALFQGRKELFKGLYAEEWLNRADFEPSPVIRLDMSKIATTKGVNMMEKSIFLMLTKIAKKHDLQIVTDVSA